MNVAPIGRRELRIVLNQTEDRHWAQNLLGHPGGEATYTDAIVKYCGDTLTIVINGYPEHNAPGRQEHLKNMPVY